VKNLLPCLCGDKPKYGKKLIGLSCYYWFLSCTNDQCKHDTRTFATREKQFCGELWNSAIKKKWEICVISGVKPTIYKRYKRGEKLPDLIREHGIDKVLSSFRRNGLKAYKHINKIIVKS